MSASRFETVDEVVAAIPSSFVPEESKGVDAVYQWVLTGEGARSFSIVVKDQGVEVMPGDATRADVTLQADSGTYLRLANGEIKGVTAILTRKLLVRGNLYLASKIDRMFRK